MRSTWEEAGQGPAEDVLHAPGRIRSRTLLSLDGPVWPACWVDHPMRQLPLFTTVVLVAGLLVWNLSFYGDLYRVRASQGMVRAQERLPRLQPRAPVQVSLAGENGGSVDWASPGRTSRSDDGGGSPLGTFQGGGQAEPASIQEAVFHHYPSGSTRSRGSLLNGHRHGRWTEFFDSGAVLMAGTYEDGTRVGEWTFHHADGSLRSRGLYVAGLRDGTWRCFHPDGRGLRSEGQHSAQEGGERVGLWTRYFTDGPIMERGAYRRGVMQGNWVFYDSEGREGPRTGLYRDGVLVKD